MPRYVLECPHCEARFRLKRYVRDERVRCRKCGEIVLVPAVEGGDEESPASLDREIRRKLARIYSIRKQAILAFALAAALAGGTILLVREYGRRGTLVRESESFHKRMTRETWEGMLSQVPFPLAPGMRWVYDVNGEGTESRRVLWAGLGPGGEPQYELRMEREGSTLSLLLRVKENGVWLVSEREKDSLFHFDPLLCVAPLPLYLDSTWEYRGAIRSEDGTVEECEISFRTEGGHAIAAGQTRSAFVVRETGKRGQRAVDGKCVYCVGVGLVEFEKQHPGGTESGALREFSGGGGAPGSRAPP